MSALKKNKSSAAAPGRSSKSWQGRLAADADAVTARFLASLDVDAGLWRYDIAGSIAHAKMLASIGAITKAEAAKIEKGLLSVGKDIAAGKLAMPIELEDIHMVVEKALIERIGDAGKKLHTGRSRNDQTATDLRLWARDCATQLDAGIVGLQRAFVKMASEQGDVVMPAYTHLQRAQPIVAGHAMLAYVEMLHRDRQRLADCLKRINVCPLGSGAVAGTSLPLDRRMTAKLLNFTEVSRNSIDATSDRDFLAELLFCCAMIATHLSRWAEDWIIMSTSEFAAIELADQYCTSSSMMPQKKNADTLELIRAKSAMATGNLTGLLTLIKGLPLAYNRDMQDDKRFVLPTVAAICDALFIAAGIVSTAKLRVSRITAAIDTGFLDATSLAEYLVGKGVPFRQAHHIVGTLVAHAEQAGKSLAEIPLMAMRKHCDKIGADVKGYLGAANVVARYAPEGSGGRRQLQTQIKFWKKAIGK